MTTRADIVAEARKWLATPFRHQGRLLGRGADCGGLVLGVGKALGVLAYDAAPVYGRRPSGNEMRRLLNQYFDPWNGPEQPGDVLLFAFEGEPQHIGIANESGGVIHVYAQARRCVEHHMDPSWRARIRGVWRFRGLVDG
jgi:NlpC/P60 family putative phage cell wall peptidase